MTFKRLAGPVFVVFCTLNLEELPLFEETLTIALRVAAADVDMTK